MSRLKSSSSRRLSRWGSIRKKGQQGKLVGHLAGKPVEDQVLGRSYYLATFRRLACLGQLEQPVDQVGWNVHVQLHRLLLLLHFNPVE